MSGGISPARIAQVPRHTSFIHIRIYPLSHANLSASATFPTWHALARALPPSASRPNSAPVLRPRGSRGNVFELAGQGIRSFACRESVTRSVSFSASSMRPAYFACLRASMSVCWSDPLETANLYIFPKKLSSADLCKGLPQFGKTLPRFWSELGHFGLRSVTFGGGFRPLPYQK